MAEPPDDADVVVLACMYWQGTPVIQPDSVRRSCDSCGESVAVSPQGLAVLEKYPEKSVVNCIGCARASLPDVPAYAAPGSDAVIRSAFGDARADRIASMMGRPLRDFATEDLLDPRNWATGRTKEE